MNINEDDFSTADVVSAVGISAVALQGWLRRDLIAGHRERKSGGVISGSQGRARRFPFRSVMEIAVAAALADLGTPIDAAFRAAVRVAYVGAMGRVAGLPWPREKGATYLGVSGDKVRLFHADGGTDIFAPFAVAGQGRPDRASIVNVSAIFDRVAARLYEDGHAPNHILESEYSEDAA